MYYPWHWHLVARLLSRSNGINFPNKFIYLFLNSCRLIDFQYFQIIVSPTNQRRISGSHSPITPETLPFPYCLHYVGLRHECGKVSKIRAIIQKAPKPYNKMDSTSTSKNNYRNVEITIQVHLSFFLMTNQQTNFAMRFDQLVIIVMSGGGSYYCKFCVLLCHFLPLKVNCAALVLS